MRVTRYLWLGVVAPAFWLSTLTAQADDEASVTLAPRVAIETGFDSNYALEPTGAVPAGQAAAAAGVGVDWAPTIRTRYGIRADYRETRFLDVEGARDSARLLSTALQATHLFSLRTSGWLRAGALVYRSPLRLGDVTTGVGSLEGGIGWRPVHSWRLRFEGGYWDIRDVAGGSRRRDHLSLARFGVARDWHGRGGFSSTLDGTRFFSPRYRARYVSAGGSLLVWVGLWNGGAIAADGNVERRWYDAASGAGRRVDLQWTGGGGLVQSLGMSQRIRLGAWREENLSAVHPFERNTVKLVWECEPNWFF